MRRARDLDVWPRCRPTRLGRTRRLQGQTKTTPLYAEAGDFSQLHLPLNNGHPLGSSPPASTSDRYANYSKPIMADLEAASIDGAYARPRTRLRRRWDEPDPRRGRYSCTFAIEFRPSSMKPTA